MPCCREPKHERFRSRSLVGRDRSDLNICRSKKERSQGFKLGSGLC